MWPMLLGMAGIGALQGLMGAKAQQKQNQTQADMAAAQTQFSPWTGMGAGKAQINTVSPVGEALKGGIGGGLAGYMHGMANAPAAPAAGTGTTGGSPYSSFGSPEEAMKGAQGDMMNRTAKDSAWMFMPTQNKNNLYSPSNDVSQRLGPVG